MLSCDDKYFLEEISLDFSEGNRKDHPTGIAVDLFDMLRNILFLNLSEIFLGHLKFSFLSSFGRAYLKDSTLSFLNDG